MALALLQPLSELPRASLGLGAEVELTAALVQKRLQRLVAVPLGPHELNVPELVGAAVVGVTL